MPSSDDGNGLSVGTTQDKQRAFLQALLSRQCLTFEDSKPLIAAIECAHTPNRLTAPEDVSQHDFEEYIQAANTSISPFDFEIRSTQHQLTKERTYVLVNTTSDAITQLATIHTADEIAYVKRVLDAMFETNNTPRAEVMAVRSMQAVNLNRVGDRRESGRQSQGPAASTGLMIEHAQEMLKDMVSEGWFELSERGFYSLSPRALMELRSWLVTMYNDAEGAQTQGSDDDEEDVLHEKIKFCAACREIVTVGQRCPNLPCNCRMHTFCVRNKFRAQGGAEKCPTCKTDWKRAPAVGEMAHPGRDEPQGRGGRRSGGGSGRRTTNGTNGTNGANGRRRASGRNMDSEMESDASGAD